jgi:hypothetical protein
MALTRRLFLERLAGAAGATVTYDAMVGLGLLLEPAARTAAFERRGSSSGTPVVVLGGGLAGIDCYELGKLGYDCRILEGRLRPADDATPSAAARQRGRRLEGGRRVRRGLYYNPGRCGSPPTTPRSTTAAVAGAGESSSTTTTAFMCSRRRPSPASGCATARSAPT